jgi:hypothetical protein
MSIKPFKSTDLQTTEKGLAGKRWVMRQIRRALGKLNISAEGIELTQNGDGSLHLSATGGIGSGEHPFRVQRRGDGYSVSPGYFYVPDWTGGEERAPYIMPTINGTPLDASTPPIYSTLSTSGYVVCRTRWNTSGAPILPWDIALLSQPPEDTPCVLLPDPNKQDGQYYVLLARVVNGVIHQQVRSTIFADVNYLGFRFTESNAAPPPET